MFEISVARKKLADGESLTHADRALLAKEDDVADAMKRLKEMRSDYCDVTKELQQLIDDSGGDRSALFPSSFH